MNQSFRPQLSLPLVGLALSLLIPSTGQVQKYLGNLGVVVYLGVAFFALWIAYRKTLPWFVSTVSEKQVIWLAVSTLLLLTIVFAVVYPIANSGIVGGGSDCDEAFNLAVTRLIHGQYPYYLRTYIGNALIQLPGSILLAVPFVLSGNSAYQNLFCIGLLFIAMRLYLKDGRFALFLLWLILVLSPVVLQQVVTGADHLSNGIYATLFTLWTARWVPRLEISHWKKMASAILLGVGLSTRANFFLLLPVIVSALAQNAGWKFATKYTALTGMTMVITIVPFYLYDPQNFPCFSDQFARIAQFQSTLPFADLLIPLGGGIIAFMLSFQQMDSNGIDLLRNCAVVQAFLVLCTVVLSTIQGGRLNFGWADYGIFFLFFGTLASWARLTEQVA